MDVNPLRKIWDSGRAAVGTFILSIRDIAIVEIAAAAGLDFVLFDLEHRAHNSETIHDQLQVARLAGMAALVGPAYVNHHAIGHALDLGASGVVIPRVETADDVAQSIQAVRYPPRGKRGRCGMAGHNLYSPRSMTEEMEDYNRQIALLLKVESEAAIHRLEQLVEPEDVDGVMVGPADLSCDMGIPGQFNHERIEALIERVRLVCRERGIQYGKLVSSPDEVPAAVKEGASWVIVGSEMDPLASSWKKASQAISK